MSLSGDLEVFCSMAQFSEWDYSNIVHQRKNTAIFIGKSVDDDHPTLISMYLSEYRPGVYRITTNADLTTTDEGSLLDRVFSRDYDPEKWDLTRRFWNIEFSFAQDELNSAALTFYSYINGLINGREDGFLDSTIFKTDHCSRGYLWTVDGWRAGIDATIVYKREAAIDAR